jgi:hypothetical protein
MPAINAMRFWATDPPSPYRIQGGVVFFSVSTLLVVPSGDTVIVFSFDSTEPSFLTFSLSEWEIVLSHPVVSKDNATADVTAIREFLNVFIVSFQCRRCFPAAMLARMVASVAPQGSSEQTKCSAMGRNP